MSFPRYPAYRDSGVEYVGEIPAHWEVATLKWLTDPARPIMYGIVLPGPDVGDGVPILKGGNVKPSRMNLGSMARTTPEIEAPYARARLKAGDLAYSIRGSIGDCEPVPPELEGANITQDVARVAIAPNSSTAWARWALLAAPVREGLASGSLGAAVRGINIFDLKRAKVPRPQCEEQAAIAAFLDRETARIDALVAEQERLIELLREKRQAVISHAVTKGLDPSVPMKDSGVEWLGQVPAHWELQPMKRLIGPVDQGGSPQCESEPASLDRWGVLKVGCMNGGVFRQDEQKALPEDVPPDTRSEIREGDILVSRGNTLELVGSAAVVPKVRPMLLLSDLIYRFRTRPGVSPAFLVYVLGSMQGRFQIERDAVGTSASMKKASKELLANLTIPSPSFEEQCRIAAFLEEHGAIADTLITEATHAITLLQERRSALITAAVTGQIDVRGLA